jgi:hypothetical protein
MSSDPNAPKPMPSAAEITAYVERSAARTRMRLPLAKGNALPVESSPTATGPAPSRALPVRGKNLPTQPAKPDATQPETDAAWTPFGDDSK